MRFLLRGASRQPLLSCAARLRVPLAAARPCLSSRTVRAFCTSEPNKEAAPAEAAPAQEEAPTLLFTGGKNQMVKYLKKASILNLGFAISAAPLLHYITSASGSGGKGIAMSAILVSFGGITTAGLNWVCGTYILSMTAMPGGKVAIETTTLFGGSKTCEVSWHEISRPASWHPFSTFEAGGSMFYLDVDDGEIHDETLVAKIESKLNE